jgi:hypothetical protein
MIKSYLTKDYKEREPITWLPFTSNNNNSSLNVISENHSFINAMDFHSNPLYFA